MVYIIRLKISFILAVLTVSSANSIAQALHSARTQPANPGSSSMPEGIPRITSNEGRTQLLVNGKPFIILGGQAHNSSASNLNDIEHVYNVLDNLHADTAEIPISWNLLEPQPGQFDFHLVDGAIERARAHDLHLIFLWFGTTKNATLAYVPDWIKRDRAKYFRALDARNQEMEAISPFCGPALEADQRAFSNLMQHIREFDGQQHTVILVQVENETGLLGTDRDYSAVATRAFNGQVPANLIAYMVEHKDDLRPALHDSWEQQGFSKRGSWTEVFGDLAPEVFSAWATAHYVDEVAAAGKAVYGLPYYINVALMNTGSARPGDWPSGGATDHVIDIWKATAKHIDIIAPDIYRVDFPQMAKLYSRPDNVLFVPETGFAPYYAPYVFTTLAGLNGIGFSPFGVDHGYDGSVQSSSVAALEENYRVLRPLLPIIIREQYHHTLFPIVLDFYRHESFAIPLGDSLSAVVHFDETFKADTSAHRGGGMIIKLAADKFVVAGNGFHVEFVELKGAQRNPEYLSIEEGTFHGDHWSVTRVLNGDEERVYLRPHEPRILLVTLNHKNENK